MACHSVLKLSNSGTMDISLEMLLYIVLGMLLISAMTPVSKSLLSRLLDAKTVLADLRKEYLG